MHYFEQPMCCVMTTPLLVITKATNPDKANKKLFIRGGNVKSLSIFLSSNYFAGY